MAIVQRGCVMLLVIAASACSGSSLTAPAPQPAPVSVPATSVSFALSGIVTERTPNGVEGTPQVSWVGASKTDYRRYAERCCFPGSGAVVLNIELLR